MPKIDLYNDPIFYEGPSGVTANATYIFDFRNSDVPRLALTFHRQRLQYK